MRSALAIGASSLLVASAARADDDWVRLRDVEPPVRLAPPPPEPEPAAPAAPEEPAARFGARGTMTISAGSVVGVSWTKFQSDASYFDALFSPGFDYFVLTNVSIGLDARIGYSDARGFGADSFVRTQTTRLGAGPRFGVNVPIGDSAWSWYPTVTLGVESVHREVSLISGPAPTAPGNPLGRQSSTTQGPWISVSAPLLVHPKPHFFLGFGPGLFREFGRVQGGPEIGGERTSWFGTFFIGGFWGGSVPAPIAASPAPASEAAPATSETADAESAPEPAHDTPAPATPPAPRPRRFGDAGVWVFTGEMGASVNATSYDGTRARSQSFSLGPGADVFVAPHVAIGIGASVFTSYSFDEQPSRSGVTSTRTGGGFAGRFAVDVPLASWMSLYPRAALGFSIEDFDVRSGNAENRYTTKALRAGLYAPVLVHPASHYFVGFGPSVSGDLVRTFSPSAGDNRGYSVGADLVVGAWL